MGDGTSAGGRKTREMGRCTDRGRIVCGSFGEGEKEGEEIKKRVGRIQSVKRTCSVSLQMGFFILNKLKSNQFKCLVWRQSVLCI